MKKFRSIMALMVAAVAVLFALMRLPYGGADEDEEGKTITSTAAQVSRDASGHVLIAIRPAAQDEIGLTTETLKPIVRSVEREAYGFVLDPVPLSKLNADLISAQAALDASQAQFRRSKRLYAEQKSVSLRDLQTAQAAYLTDKTRLEALEQQLRDEWGEELARMDSRTRSELVSALIDRREAIARVTVPIAEVVDSPGKADLVVLGHEREPLAARAVYDAPTVDPKMQGQSFLLLVSTSQFPVRPGTAVSAHLPASATAEQGVMVPRSAVVRYAAKEWVYEELGADRFVRREIVPAESTDDGYLMTGNFRGGIRIVVTGAQMLLSQELKSQIHLEN